MGVPCGGKGGELQAGDGKVGGILEELLEGHREEQSGSRGSSRIFTWKGLGVNTPSLSPDTRAVSSFVLPRRI